MRDWDRCGFEALPMPTTVYPEAMESAPGDPLTPGGKAKRVSLPLNLLLGIAFIAALLLLIVGIACYYGGKAKGHSLPPSQALKADKPESSGSTTSDATTAESTTEAATTAAKAATTLSEPEIITPDEDYEKEPFEEHVDEEEDEDPPAAEELRLPGNVVPERYHIGLKIYLPAEGTSYPPEKNFTFDGNLEVFVECKENTSQLRLNANRLNIVQKSIMLEEVTREGLLNGIIDIVEMADEQERLGMIGLKLSRTMEAGKYYRLIMDYTGIVNSHLAGLYRSHYQENGKTKWLAVTQFQPIDARSVFPGWDEPAYKAVFGATIRHPSSMRAISNGMETGTVDEGEGWSRTAFENSPRMSTYLVAYAVCDFHSTTKTTKRGIPFRVWARPDFVNQTSYAADIGPRILDYYEEYFGVDFPLNKQDMIALPDFEAGAMENWGLITYREVYLLFDPINYDISSKVTVARVVAHELGHMWFGNLVTLQWWDDLWLNEGFATMMEYVGTEHVTDGKAKMWDQFVEDSVGNSFSRDSESSSHPLFVPIERVSDIDAVFDIISYDKGAAILKMVEHVIGKDTFQKGLSSYIRKFEYDNTVHTDFWNSMSETTLAEGAVKDWDGNILNVTSFAESWTRQMGFPLISVKRVGDQVILSQKRFKENPNSTENERYQNNTYGYQWKVPIWYETKISNDSALSWLVPDESRKLTDLASNDWIIVNPSTKGFYRIHYEEEMMKKHAKLLMEDHEAISTMDRFQLIDDAFALAGSGQLNFSSALQLVEYIGKENEYMPWNAAMGNLNSIANRLKETADFSLVQTYMLERLGPLYERYNWDTPVDFDDAFQVKMLGLGVAYPCHFEHAACLAAGRRKFAALRAACAGPRALTSEPCNPITPSLRRIAYQYAVRYGGAEEFDWLWDKFVLEQVAVERTRLLSALTYSKTPWIIRRLLERSIRGDRLRSGDIPRVWVLIGNGDVGGSVAWDFFVQHARRIFDKLSKTTFLLKYVVKGATSWFYSEYHLDQLRSFMAMYPKETDNLMFEEALAATESNIAWHMRNDEALAEFFSNLTAKA